MTGSPVYVAYQTFPILFATTLAAPTLRRVATETSNRLSPDDCAYHLARLTQVSCCFAVLCAHFSASFRASGERCIAGKMTKKGSRAMRSAGEVPVAKRRKMSVVSGFARKESTPVTQHHLQELAEAGERAHMPEGLHGEEPLRVEGPEIVSALQRGGLLAILQAAQVADKRELEAEHPCAPLTGTLPLGEGRNQLGEVPLCTQEGRFPVSH